MEPQRRSTQTVPTRPLGLRWLLCLTLLAGGIALWRLIYPFDWIDAPTHAWLSHDRIGKLNTASNLLLFAPFAFGLAWWLRSSGRGGLASIVAPMFATVLLSLGGETVQLWQHERESSAIDVFINTGGALIGALLGFGLAPTAQRLWNRAAKALADRPIGSAALNVMLLTLLVRLCPFDLTLETLRMRQGLDETRAAGLPFHFTRLWLNDRLAAPQRAMLHAEWWRAGVSFVLFAVLTWYVVRAIREDGLVRGRRRWATPWTFCIVLLTLLGTEVLHGFARSRVMEATEPVAGAAGMLAVLLLNLATADPKTATVLRPADR